MRWRSFHELTARPLPFPPQKSIHVFLSKEPSTSKHRQFLEKLFLGCNPEAHPVDRHSPSYFWNLLLAFHENFRNGPRLNERVFHLLLCEQPRDFLVCKRSKRAGSFRLRSIR